MFSTVSNIVIIIFTGKWRQFLERQDDQFVLRKGDSTAFVRMDTINEENPHQLLTISGGHTEDIRAVSPSNLIAGFKTYGVYPFDNQAVQPITVGKNGEDFEL